MRKFVFLLVLVLAMARSGHAQLLMFTGPPDPARPAEKPPQYVLDKLVLTIGGKQFDITSGNGRPA